MEMTFTKQTFLTLGWNSVKRYVFTSNDQYAFSVSFFFSWSMLVFLLVLYLIIYT